RILIIIKTESHQNKNEKTRQRVFG
ncbi:MAG: hypothetical protein RJB23_750, partial [Pseudomonadota bacterium]